MIIGLKKVKEEIETYYSSSCSLLVRVELKRSELLKNLKVKIKIFSEINRWISLQKS